jgi:hypothetical protein
MTTPTNNTGQQVCPYGSQQASIQAAFCVGAIDVAAAAPLAELFAGGAIAAWATDLIAGLNLGTILVADLCSTPPIDPGPFDPAWFFGPSFGDNARGIIAWIIRATYMRLFQSCCQCAPPPLPTAQLVATISGIYSGGTSTFVPVKNPYEGQTSVMQTVFRSVSPFPSGGSATWTNAQQGTWSATANPSCATNIGTTGNDPSVGFGPAGCTNKPLHCGAYGSQVTSPVFAVSAAAHCIGVAFSFQGGAGGQFGYEADVYVTPSSSIPLTGDQLFPPGFGLAPSGAPSTTGTIPYPANGQVFCNFAKSSAQGISEIIFPQGAEPLAVHPLTGTGGVAVPPGASGAVLALGALPPNVGRDTGSPPQLYQVGWLAWADPDGNILGPQMRITSANQQIWGATDQATQLRYNLYPGVSGELTFLAAPIPT